MASTPPHVGDSVPGWRARRPRNSSLSVERAGALLRNRPPSFEEGLGEVEELGYPACS